jgi:hypothetical protein
MGDGGAVDFFDCRAAAEMLTYDLLRAVRTIGLDASQLGQVLGADAHFTSAMLAARAFVDPSTPAGQRAVRLVRLHRALGDAYGSVDAVDRFLRRADPDDGVVPVTLLEEPDGIERVFARLNCTEADVWRPVAYRHEASSGTGAR